MVGDRSLIGAAATIGANSTVGSNCSVGIGATVGANCTLGDGSVLCAGAVLPPNTQLPAREVWTGAPAARVGTAAEAEAAVVAENVSLAARIAAVHAEECWKDAALVEEEAGDYKIAKQRTPQYISTLREDPKWTPLPSLGDFLERSGAYEISSTPK